MKMGWACFRINFSLCNTKGFGCTGFAHFRLFSRNAWV